MKPRHAFGAVAVCCVVFFALVPSMCAQEAPAPRHTGVPQDWSQRHIVFSLDGLARHPDLIYREPRIRHQAMQRWQAPNSDVFHGAAPRPASAGNSGHHRDWSATLAGHLALNMFPAKFSFDPGAPPDCANDFVVFGLAAAETPGVPGVPPNLVAFNNLYAGTLPAGLCGAAPTVLFAYNITTVTGGKISTSPILSLDGTKIAFVESVAGSTQAIFHVLTWKAGQGTLTAAAAPTPTSMTSLLFSPTANSTTSSPWIDYGSDIVYLGADKGQIYKITSVFNGTPTLAGGPWPVTVSAGYRLTSPVLDSRLGVLMVGSGNGKLYKIDTAGGVFPPFPVGVGTDHSILAAPIVDVTNGTTFVVSANDGTSAVLVEVDTNKMTQLSKARIGQGATGVTPPAPALNLYEPAFDNNYFTDPSTGNIRLCGTGATDTSPWQYAFGFTVIPPSTQPIINTGTSSQLLTSAAARCTGWTEFFNPFAGSADTITATSVASNVLTVTASNKFTVGEKVYIQGTEEGFLNGQPVIVASLIGSAPAYTGFTASFTASSYSNASDTGTVTAGTDFFFFGLTQDCTAPGALGGCVVALSSDATLTKATVIGGPSGIIVDNYSTDPQASSIYLSSRNRNTVYKFTQNNLQ